MPGHAPETLGVAAEQWKSPKLIVPSETRLVALLTEGDPRLFFRYWAQSDPDRVFARLRAGQDLPDRYSR